MRTGPYLVSRSTNHQAKSAELRTTRTDPARETERKRERERCEETGRERKRNVFASVQVVIRRFDRAEARSVQDGRESDLGHALFRMTSVS